MRFTIDLSDGKRRGRTRIDRISVAVAVILLATLAWNGMRCASNLGEEKRLRDDIAGLKKRAHGRAAPVSESQRASILAETRFFNDIIERRAFGWLELLEQVENATPDGIWLSSLVPDRKTGAIRVEGLAANFSTVRVYLEKLEDSGRFADAQLVSHEKKSLWEQAGGVRFSVTFRERRT